MAAIARLIAMSRQEPKLTSNTLRIDDALLAQFDSLPNSPMRFIESRRQPRRIGTIRVPQRQTVAQTVDQTTSRPRRHHRARFTMFVGFRLNDHASRTDHPHVRRVFHCRIDFRHAPPMPPTSDIAGRRAGAWQKFSDAQREKPTSHGFPRDHAKRPSSPRSADAHQPGEAAAISPSWKSDAQLFDRTRSNACKRPKPPARATATAQPTPSSNARI